MSQSGKFQEGETQVYFVPVVVPKGAPVPYGSRRIDVDMLQVQQGNFNNNRGSRGGPREVGMPGGHPKEMTGGCSPEMRGGYPRVIPGRYQYQEKQREQQVPEPPANNQDVDDSMNPMWKTKMCKFSKFGLCCRGTKCHYAHSEDELRVVPDFSRTSVCPVLLRDGACNDPSCRYAHSHNELREVPGLMRTKMCRFHQNGGCYLGNRCRFAHDPQDLVTEVMLGQSQSDADTVSTRSQTPPELSPKHGRSGFNPVQLSDQFWADDHDVFENSKHSPQVPVGRWVNDQIQINRGFSNLDTSTADSTRIVCGPPPGIFSDFCEDDIFTDHAPPPAYSQSRASRSHAMRSNTFDRGPTALDEKTFQKAFAQNMSKKTFSTVEVNNSSEIFETLVQF